MPASKVQKAFSSVDGTLHPPLRANRDSQVLNSIWFYLYGPLALFAVLLYSSLNNAADLGQDDLFFFSCHSITFKVYLLFILNVIRH